MSSLSSDESDVEVESAKSIAQRKKLQKAQAEVDEVAGIMKVSIDKLLDRGEKLDDLLENAEGLQFKAMTFKSTAKQVKQKYWWKNAKLWVLIIVIFLLIVGIIVIAALQPWNM
ncbi:vesicle-associated membrane protein 3-like [Amphiura filiformis]|uniref:vesicle-associated membrane protein 3-like n=1 Tax=Amphiura filiformis TaxID=82378 RepID=UPI003B2121DE